MTSNPNPGAAAPMLFWCFAGPKLWVLTADPTGGNLPSELGPWTYHQAIGLADVQPDERQALAAIREVGLCYFDPTT